MKVALSDLEEAEKNNTPIGPKYGEVVSVEPAYRIRSETLRVITEGIGDEVVEVHFYYVENDQKLYPVGTTVYFFGYFSGDTGSDAKVKLGAIDVISFDDLQGDIV